MVRQTVSKWERGLSVPDAEMLVAIGEVLDTPVSTLPGETVPTSEPRAYRRSPKSLRC
ncbi:MAG: helix-turn-helix domain-containing protein [Collinsella sp.]